MPCPEENNQQAFEELQASLLSYETENGFVQIQDTKGFWSVLGRIVAADAFGFMFGSVGGAGLGTIISVVSSLSQSITELITYPDYMTKSALNDYSSIANSLGCVGEEHNAYLNLFLTTHTEDISSMTSDELRAYIHQWVYDTYSGFSKPSREEYMAIASSMPRMEEYSTVDEMAIACKASVPSVSGEIDIVTHCLKTMVSVNDASRLVDYCNGISTVIEESSLSVPAKQNIKSGLSVSAFSTLYWDELD